MLKSDCVSSHVFVPVTDELIFDTPELIEGPLVPYASGMECHGWLSIEINPEEDIPAAVARPAKPNFLHRVSTKVAQKRATSAPKHIRLAYSN